MNFITRFPSLNDAPATSARVSVSGSCMLRFWLPTCTMIMEESILNSSTSLLSTNGIFITSSSTPSTVLKDIGLSEAYTVAGSSSPKSMSAIWSSLSRPLSSVLIM